MVAKESKFKILDRVRQCRNAVVHKGQDEKQGEGVGQKSLKFIFSRLVAPVKTRRNRSTVVSAQQWGGYYVKAYD